MDISKYTVEDFALNREFRAWVFSPSQSLNKYWERLFEKYPAQVKNAKIAKEILLNLNYPNHQFLEREYLEVWDRIDRETEEWEKKKTKTVKVVSLNSQSLLGKYENSGKQIVWFSQELRVAGILLVAFSLSLIFGLFFKKEPVKTEYIADAVYEEYSAPPGVKSTLTMQDGSKVLLNSGSSVRFIKNFEEDKRIIYLEGEAYFEVAKDTLRPFSVITGEVTTTALGTSFNISAYRHEVLKIALVEGKVAVDVVQTEDSRVLLEKGEALKINTNSGEVKKEMFDSELVIAWTKKKIIFQRVKLAEAVRILENWYGVKFRFQNTPSPDLVLYGVFQDETLENILEGLSYSARFQYKIKNDEVIIIFK
ncbi:FecR family protein [Algoriphagus alkaliphilus]|uniref:FecR family protein n=1 Tax=Algoriphagus alkaliphilus TaxID=279824 RepID=A0A1G5VBZ9_9BACT|nr:FecR family protein [Algoriphagus alkaliphilus]MBA4299707.1 FecR family protein [Cyclobacterium sp.]SDA43314.1 FecR family protein [Algoriphagus alkaliphilus]